MSESHRVLVNNPLVLDTLISLPFTLVTNLSDTVF